MNQSSNELAALGRIIRVIKRFRQTAPDSKTASQSVKDAFLKQHLSKQDWLVWEQLQAEPQDVLANNQAPVSDQALSPQQFSLLLSQYKRVGFESYQLWYQTQTNSICIPSDLLSSC